MKHLLLWLLARAASPLGVAPERRAGELREILGSLGPAVIKAGQALASRPDLLPAEYLRELQKLQDRVPQFDTGDALRRVEASLGLDRFEDAFELLEAEPIAAASIGQVYKARLIKEDVVVALKVQRPRCAEIIALDLYILRWWAQLGTSTLSAVFDRNLDLVSVIDDFGRLIYQEIDYAAERKNAKRFGDLYGKNLIKVPRVYGAYSSSTVLCMEWVTGTRLVDGEELVRSSGDADAPGRLVDALVQCSLRQMLESGYFHADPHAGNLLATADGQLCYLDFGMMSYLDRRQRVSIIEAVVHLVNRDFEALAALYERMGFIPAGTDVEPIVRGLQEALPDVLDAPVSTRASASSRAYPYIAARLLTDEAPELRAALKNLLFQRDRPQWTRFEALIGRASSSDGYDAAAAADVLVTFLGSDDAEAVRDHLVDDLADALDYLGVEVGLELGRIVGLELDDPGPLFGRPAEGDRDAPVAAGAPRGDFLVAGADDGARARDGVGALAPVARRVADDDAPVRSRRDPRASERASRAIRLALAAATAPSSATRRGRRRGRRRRRGAAAAAAAPRARRHA
ncbi:hypothetical protein JL722_10159 [Aureococcus anophagefferens]|nr:hypothetical protein JL722_10159 [Aureococcus anophagefferens]